MTLALQTLPQPEDTCLDFALAFEITSTVCKSIGFNFNQSRLGHIAILFDLFVREGQSPTTAMTGAIDIELAIRGNPLRPRQLSEPRVGSGPGSGLQRLSRDEEDALLVLIEFHDISLETLRCHFTRQQGKGLFKAKQQFKFIPQDWAISYNLVLCEFCGNFEGMAANALYCPAKLRVLRDQLLDWPDATSSERLLTEADE